MASLERRAKRRPRPHKSVVLGQPRVESAARRCVGPWGARRPRGQGLPRRTVHDDGGHGPAPHPVIKTERLAHYYK